MRWAGEGLGELDSMQSEAVCSLKGGGVCLELEGVMQA